MLVSFNRSIYIAAFAMLSPPALAVLKVLPEMPNTGKATSMARDECEKLLEALGRLLAIRPRMNIDCLEQLDEIIKEKENTIFFVIDTKLHTSLPESVAFQIIDGFMSVMNITIDQMSTDQDFPIKYWSYAHRSIAKLFDYLNSDPKADKSKDLDAVTRVERLTKMQTMLPDPHHYPTCIDSLISKELNNLLLETMNLRQKAGASGLEVAVKIAMKAEDDSQSVKEEESDLTTMHRMMGVEVDASESEGTPASTETEATETQISLEEHHSVRNHGSFIIPINKTYRLYRSSTTSSASCQS